MIVITGGSGYVGSHIVKKLVALDKPLRVIVRDKEKAKQEGRLSGLDVEWVQGDVTRAESLKPPFSGADAIIHTVAIAIERGGQNYEDINTQGTVNVVEAAKSMGVQRLINISQLGADSKLPYRFLASKGKAQEYVASSGLDWTAFRPSVIWGPEDEFANTFAKLVPLSPVIFPIVDQEAMFQPVWVEDVATAVVKALEDPSTIRKEYELGGPEILSIEEIERRTLEAIGARRIMIPFPRGLMNIVVTLLERTLPAPPVTRSLLELLSVKNVTTANSIHKFVESPRPFTPENTATYIREFQLGQTLKEFFGR